MFLLQYTFLLFLYFFVLKSTSAIILGVGPCPDITVVQDFDISQYLGVWYEAEKFFFAHDTRGICKTVTYAATDVAGVISIVNSQTNPITRAVSSTKGIATQTNPSGEAKLTVTIQSNSKGVLTVPHWILSTDYDTYAVVWSCQEMSNAHSESGWILTRERIPSKDVLQTAYEVFDSRGIIRTTLAKTNQTNC